MMDAPSIAAVTLSDDERHKAIEAALSQAAVASHSVRGPEGYIDLPVVTLPIAVPLYRAENGRILSEIERYAGARFGSVDAYIDQTREDERQAVLHGLLLEKARDPRGPIHDELARFARQTEPLLIERDGIVLNGNRRLAAMRDLMARDPNRYAAFADLRVAVLPAGLSRSAIEFIEAGLQMAPEMKLDYSWINRRLKLRQHAADLPEADILSAYRFDGAEDIRNELEELELAERYLEWIGSSGEYGLVADESESFEGLSAQLDALKDEAAKPLWRLLGFAMLHARRRLSQPVLHYYPFIDPVPVALRNWVLRTMAEERGFVRPQSAGEDRRLEPQAAQELETALDRPDDAEPIAREAMGLIDSLKADEDRLLGGNRSLQHLRKARKALDAIDIDALSSHQLRQIRAEAAAIQAHVAPQDEQKAMPLSVPFGDFTRMIYRNYRRFVN